MTGHYTPWTPEAFEAMKLMWTEGKSAAEIGRKLGLSRNAILGKIHRNNLEKLLPRLSVPKSTVPPEHRAKRRRRVLPSLPALKAVKPLRAAPPPAAPDATRVSILDVTGCKWAMTAVPPHLFCNGDRVEGRPYCAHHESRAVNPLIKVRGGVRA